MTIRTLTTWLKKGIVSLVLVTTLGVSGGFAQPPQAHAALSVFDSANFAENVETAVQSTISAAADVATSLGIESLVTKEFAFDKIAFALAQYTLRKITNSIINWINSGFQGSPAFVQDFPRFIQDTIDEAAGHFIYGTELGWLCSPFELDIRIALAQQHFQRFEAARCSITDIINNVENFATDIGSGNFFSANFLDVGWDGWFEIIRQRNNPYSTYNIAQAELGLRTARAEEDLRLKLEIDEGFISWEECDPIDGGGEEDEQCRILTPGHVISEHLKFTIQGGQRTLLNADEINEVVLALFAQLAQQAITGTAGLLGLSQTGSGGGGSGGSSPSYLDRLAADTGVTPGDGSTSFITEAIGGEQQYINIQQRVVNRVNDLQALLISGNATCPATPDNLSSTFSSYRNNAQSEISQSQQNIATLNLMASQFDTATPEEQNEIAVEFATLQATGGLHTSVDNAVAQFEIDDRIDDINAEINRVSSIIASCNNSGGGSDDPPIDRGR